MGIIETDLIEIEYAVQKNKGYANVPPIEFLDIKRISVYVQAIDDWIEVTDVESEQLDKEVNRLIQEDQSEHREKAYDV